MEKFVKFWTGTWEDESETPNKKWMNDKIILVEELQITEQELEKIIKKRKN